MSYSFNIKAKSKDEAKKRIEEEFDRVVQAQDVHKADRDQAQAAAKAFVDICPDPTDSQVLYVNVSGSVSWRGSGTSVQPHEVTAAAFNISVSTQ